MRLEGLCAGDFTYPSDARIPWDGNPVALATGGRCGLEWAERQRGAFSQGERRVKGRLMGPPGGVIGGEDGRRGEDEAAEEIDEHGVGEREGVERDGRDGGRKAFGRVIVAPPSDEGWRLVGGARPGVGGEGNRGVGGMRG